MLKCCLQFSRPSAQYDSQWIVQISGHLQSPSIHYGLVLKLKITTFLPSKVVFSYLRCSELLSGPCPQRRMILQIRCCLCGCPLKNWWEVSLPNSCFLRVPSSYCFLWTQTFWRSALLPCVCLRGREGTLSSIPWLYRQRDDEVGREIHVSGSQLTPVRKPLHLLRFALTACDYKNTSQILAKHDPVI